MPSPTPTSELEETVAICRRRALKASISEIIAEADRPLDAETIADRVGDGPSETLVRVCAKELANDGEIKLQKTGGTKRHHYSAPEVVADGGESLKDAIEAELAEAGTSGMDPLILAARIEYTLNATVEVLEAMVEAEEAEYVQQRSYHGRYRLVDAAPEAEL